MAFNERLRRRCASLALVCVPTLGMAQADVPTRVTITATRPLATVAGFGNLPLQSLPMQLVVIDTEQMKDFGINRLADINRLDASVGDGYNADGYYDFLSVRGFVIDNRFNYRRDGLPISAETSLPLDNKSRIEVLKGTSGMQAGVGSPGGLVNLVVKRPTATPIRQATLGWQQDGSVLLATDLGDRFGAQRQFGLRLNAAYQSLDPQTHHLEGHRYLLALAGDWRFGDMLVEAEVENSRRSQPSAPGFSVLGSVVPEPGNPRINLNDQPWSQPSSFKATTGSLRVRRRLGEQWQALAQLATQQLSTDDRTAFPYGCSAEGLYDRYCSDGTYDLYDYRSDNERRRNNVFDLSASGPWRSGPLQHEITVGVQFNRVTNRAQPLAFNYAGIGNVQGTLFTPPAPDANTPGSNRDMRSNEAYLRDDIALDPRTNLWLGLRLTRQTTRSELTDGSQATSFSQTFTSPWLALSHRLAAGTLLYASWGTGYESDVAPNQPIYSNRGQALSALRSRQVEVGAKGALGAHGEWMLAAFDIERPVSADIGSCDLPDTCRRVRDGNQVHRGVEAGLTSRLGNLRVDASAMALHARRDDSVNPELDGLQPVNVPAWTLRAQLGYSLPSMPALELLGNVSYESSRMVLPDNSLSIPGFARFDIGARFAQRVGRTELVWRAGIDNLFNRRAWRESPFQFAHSYLFPLAPRTFGLSVQASL